MHINAPRCAAPFVQLLLRPDGRATPCCYLYGLTVGDAKTHGWQQVWNSGKLRRLRREILDGSPRTCKARMREIGCHKQFEHWQGVVWRDIQTDPPRRLDLRLNGQCNLSCRMCDVWQQPNGLYDESFIWREGPTQLFPYLDEIDVLGGEPFVQRDTFRLIDAVSSVNRDCRWGFVTNGHYPWSKRLETYLGRIFCKYIQVSLDAVCAHTYARQRGGNLSLPLATIERLLALRNRKPFDLKVSLCVTSDNWWEIPAFLRLCDQLAVEPVLQMTYYAPRQGVALPKMNQEDRRQIAAYVVNTTSASLRSHLAPVLKALGEEEEVVKLHDSRSTSLLLSQGEPQTRR